MSKAVTKTTLRSTRPPKGRSRHGTIAFAKKIKRSCLEYGGPENSQVRHLVGIYAIIKRKSAGRAIFVTAFQAELELARRQLSNLDLETSRMINRGRPAYGIIVRFNGQIVIVSNDPEGWRLGCQSALEHELCLSKSSVQIHQAGFGGPVGLPSLENSVRFGAIRAPILSLERENA
jgi:hypothetical protein